METNQYIDIFIEEATENLQNLNQALLELEKNQEDDSILNNIFRIAHTLKGMAGTMGFNKMSKLTHVMEDILQKVRNHELVLDEELIELLFHSLDALDGYVKCIVESGNEGLNEYHDLITALRSISDGGMKGKSAKEKSFKEKDKIGIRENIGYLDTYERNIIKKAHQLDMNVYRINIHLEKECVLKAARAFIIFQVLERYSDIIKSEPEVMDIEDEKFDTMFSVIVISKESKDVIIKELYKVAEVEKVELSVLDKDYEKIADMKDTNDVKCIKDAKGTNDIKEIKDTKGSNAYIQKKQRTSKTVRVDIERLDVLLNLVGELIIQKPDLKKLMMIKLRFMRNL